MTGVAGAMAMLVLHTAEASAADLTQLVSKAVHARPCATLCH
jgi:hypothetical protein